MKPHGPLWAAAFAAVLLHAAWLLPLVTAPGGDKPMAQPSFPEERRAGAVRAMTVQSSEAAQMATHQHKLNGQPGAAAVRPAATQTTAQPTAGSALKPTPTQPPATNSVHPGVQFWPTPDLDMRALPLRSPDTEALQGLPWPPPSPIRLNLLITAQGEVVKVEPVEPGGVPAELRAALETMFKATPFMPARRHGRDVASHQVIELMP